PLDRLDAAPRTADDHRAAVDELLEVTLPVRLARDAVAVPGVALVRRQGAQRGVDQLHEVGIPGGALARPRGRVGVVAAAEQDRESGELIVDELADRLGARERVAVGTHLRDALA